MAPNHGRPKPGVSVEQVRANFDGAFYQTVREILAGKLEQSETPRLEIASGSLGLTSGSEGYAQPLLILTVIMILVLVIASLNVANLLLARAAARQKEIATRLSVGATQIRLMRQLRDGKPAPSTLSPDVLVAETRAAVAGAQSGGLG